MEDIDLYRPARFSGKVLRRHYARAQELQLYLRIGATEGELCVQVFGSGLGMRR